MPAKRHINENQLSMLEGWQPSTWAPHSREWHQLEGDDPSLEDHHIALNAFMNGTPEDPMAESSHSFDAEMHPRLVDPYDTSHVRHPASDDRVAYAIEGYRDDPEKVPPIILVKRGDTHEVVDGHHRLSAAKRAGVENIRAWVADSSRTDEWTPPDY
jgi:hypothetical protein